MNQEQEKLFLGDINSVDGAVIQTGKFSGFKLIAQKTFGVKNDLVNVYGLSGTCIGYIIESDLQPFAKGNSQGFTPEGGWTIKWSKNLITLFGLGNSPVIQAAQAASTFEVTPSDQEAGKVVKEAKDVDIHEVIDLDPEYAAKFKKPWIAVEEDGTVHEFSDEDSVCAFQREYRVRNGLDAMTGELARKASRAETKAKKSRSGPSMM